MASAARRQSADLIAALGQLLPPRFLMRLLLNGGRFGERMNQRSPSPGDLVEVEHEPVAGLAVQPEGRKGIAVAREPRPSQRWLDSQQDGRWREHADAPWWSVAPLEGGLVLVPERLLVSRGRASRDVVMQAVAHANDHGARALAAIFPEIVAELLVEKSG